ncbi:hypothetical protein PGB90_008974 [Kerria lacca]
MEMNCVPDFCTSTVNTYPRVVYIHNKLLMLLCSRIPNIQNRANIVHALIKSYNLLINTRVIDVKPANYQDLCQFHSSLYIDFLKKISKNYTSAAKENKELVAEILSKESDDYGIGYDCPIVDHIFTLVSLIGGSSICAAKELCENSADIAINWYGGWHHAQRDTAEGFCYVNDIVLAIEILRTKFQRVLYIDLDIHHGNGVENAYNFTQKVFTLSFHKYESGFYPGSGDVHDIGIGKGKFYTVNVPLKEGINDNLYCYMFKKLSDEIKTAYQPQAVVIQCGVDGLTGDKLGGFNLTLTSFGYCLKEVLNWKKPTLILGGGGYNKANVARCWTYLTSLVVGRPLSNNIPDNEYFSEYGPDFTLQIFPSNRKNYNTKDYIDDILKKLILERKFMNNFRVNANDPEFVKNLLAMRKDKAIHKLLLLLPFINLPNDDLKQIYLKIMPVFLSYAEIFGVNLKESVELVCIIRGHSLFMNEKRLFDAWLDRLTNAYELAVTTDARYLPKTKSNYSSANRFTSISGTDLLDTIGYAELDFFNGFHRFLKFHKLHKYLYFFANLSYYEICSINESNIRYFEDKVNIFPMTTGARNAILRKLNELNLRRSRLCLLYKNDLKEISQLKDYIEEIKAILRTPIRGITIYKEDNSLPDLLILVIGKVIRMILNSNSLKQGYILEYCDEMICIMKRSWSCYFFSREQKRLFNIWRKQLSDKKGSFSYASEVKMSMVKPVKVIQEEELLENIIKHLENLILS